MLVCPPGLNAPSRLPWWVAERRCTWAAPHDGFADLLAFSPEDGSTKSAPHLTSAQHAMPSPRCCLAFGSTLLVALSATALARAEKSSLPPEIGYHYGEVEDARWAACGGALRALSNGATSVWANPAGMTM